MFKCKLEKRASAIKKIRAKFGRNVSHEVLVFCSGRNIYAQVVDLKNGNTKFSISTCDKNDKKNHRNIATASKLGSDIAKKCKQENITNVSFNRAEKIFHGVVKAVADGFYQE